MKKSRIKDLVTGNIAEKLYQIAHSKQYPTLICLLAYAFYYVDLFLFYIFAPFALGGFSYLFYERKKDNDRANLDFTDSDIFLFTFRCFL